MTEEPLVRRDHKSRLFIKLFEDKQSLLELYNAINGSEYTDPEALIVTTIEDAIFMGIKNDVSFLLENRINLYEHQSTWNPNMPLRGLLYFSKLYQGYVREMGLDVFSSKLLPLPVPKYLVFYNGTREAPDRMELRLSDAFAPQEGKEYSLECRATLININFGHNQKLMKSCRRLHEYSYFIAKVRECVNAGHTVSEAVELAVEHCTKEGILAEFLLKHQGEVKDMILTTYDEELHIRSEKALSYEEGVARGEERGEKRGRLIGERCGEERISALYSRLIKEQRLLDLERATEDKEFQRRLLEEYGIK